MNVRGGFSTCELSTVEKDTFSAYLQHSMNNPALEFIKYLLGDDYIKFIDVMSGTTLKIPSSKSLEHDLELVRIYLYIKRQGFTELSIKEAAKAFGKSVLTIRRYVLKVSKVLGIEDILEGDDLNNYISFIKSVEQMDSYYYTKLEAKQDEIREKKRLNSSKCSEHGVDDIEVDKELIEVCDETLNQFYEDRKNNKFIEFIEIIKKEYNLLVEVKVRKSGNYLRLFSSSDNKKPIVDCVLNKSGWNLDFFYNNTSTRDSIISKLKDRYRVSICGKSAITFRGIDNIETFRYLMNLSVRNLDEVI